MSKCFGDFYEQSLEEEHLRKTREKCNTGFKNPKQYIKFKLKMLRRDMYIEPTQKEVDHLYTLTTETAIDNAVHSIIARHWNRF